MFCFTLERVTDPKKLTDKIEVTLLENVFFLQGQTKEVTFYSAQVNLLQEFHSHKCQKHEALTVLCLCCDWFLKNVLDIKG